MSRTKQVEQVSFLFLSGQYEQAYALILKDPTLLYEKDSKGSSLICYLNVGYRRRLAEQLGEKGKEIITQANILAQQCR